MAAIGGGEAAVKSTWTLVAGSQVARLYPSSLPSGIRASVGNLYVVPELNAVNLDLVPAGALIRFRGMVQDMLDAEYYVGTFHVPGESAWAREAAGAGVAVVSSGQPALAAAMDAAGWGREKRPRADDMEVTAMDAKDSSDAVGGGGPGGMLCDVKRVRELDGAAAVAPPPSPLGLNMPLGNAGGLRPCLVRVYDGADSDLRLNDVAEFVGVLGRGPELALPTASGVAAMLDDSVEDLGGASPPASQVGQPVHRLCNGPLTRSAAAIAYQDRPSAPVAQVPRLHCIVLRKLPPPETGAGGAPAIGGGSLLRTSLLAALAGVLGGDRLAAEYLLLHLLSRVHTRTDLAALGKLSLNLVGCSAAAPPAPAAAALAAPLAAAIAQLVPRSHLLPLSLDLLNGHSLAPHKNYAANRLETGQLQLAEGTELVVDELALQSGRVSASGVQNLEALKQLVEWQKVEYDFQFYKMDVPVDVPVVVLSQARSKLLPADAVVQLCPADGAPGSLAAVPEPLLEQWRAYLNAARHMEHIIGASMAKASGRLHPSHHTGFHGRQEALSDEGSSGPVSDACVAWLHGLWCCAVQVLEEDLVAARQEDRSLTPDAFHRWLTLARLLCASYGERELSVARWREARSLEAAREARTRRCASGAAPALEHECNNEDEREEQDCERRQRLQPQAATAERCRHSAALAFRRMVQCVVSAGGERVEEAAVTQSVPRLASAHFEVLHGLQHSPTPTLPAFILLAQLTAARRTRRCA
eukprot:SM000025S08335  [mRNA]  locus=s25:142771:147905:+ [translate_table: standard]